MTSNVNVGNNLTGGIMMRGSNSNGNVETNASLQNELELLLLQQQQQQNQRIFLEREMDLNINRSGSAPPTVDGALRAAGNLFKNPSFEQFDDNARSSGTDTSLGFLTEEEIRSHPAYLEYYYSNENLNPRLPPPLFSKEDWRLAQRVRAAGFGLDGIGDSRDKNSIDNDGRSSLFSMQPGLSVKKAEDDLVELRKAALRNISRKNSAEFLDRVSIGLGGPSSSGMGVRRKSFADILQEGLGQPAKSNLSRPASHNSIGDVLYSTGIFNSNAAEIQSRAESPEAMLPGKAFTGLSSSQKGSTLSPSFASSMGSSVAPTVPSSGIFEVADIADSLSGLSVSKGQLHTEDVLKSSLQMRMTDHKHNPQQHYFEMSRADQLVNNINYAHLSKNNGSSLGLNISNSLTQDQMSFPRRTSSPSNHHPQLNPSDYASSENLKILYQGNSYPGMDVPSHGHRGYAVNQKPDMMINNDLAAGSLLTGATGDGHNLRSSNRAGLHFPVTNPDQYQYLRVPGNSSQGRYVGTPHGHEDLPALEKAYLEALLVQQNQQYLSQFLHKSSSVNHQYHGNPSFGPSYQGNVNVNSFHSTVGSRSPMFQNEKSAQFPSTNKSIKGESSGSLHSPCGNNMKGRCESLLEVVKNNKAKSLELSDVLTHVVEFSTDQYGSRFIQQKLETATVEENMKIFTEIIPHARNLMIDVFGNYVIQKFFEHGTENQRKELAGHLIGHVLPLSLQMYGCRVIQKALEVVDVELRTQMVAELDGSVLKCVRDQNGNHVIQKCIECVPQDRIQFIISSFFGQVVALSTHPYGCRVIQRVLEHCVDPKTQTNIMDEIMSSVCNLAQDQYGNYVLQHVLQHGKPHERSTIISKLAGQIVKMSQQKFASNVIEKCLTFGGPEERQLLVNEMLGSTPENEPLQAMMKDPFGNYVVQKVLETCDDRSRELILSRIKVHLTALKRYTYGKHIVSRVEKLVATGEKHKGQSSSNSC
ncbi:hypothetical protein BUALT_Bualt06G0025400 [Buddleja alternifolia]|uniref:PUM-HD domain-containing protein n=1 Tax=Buddleja alternifolia TaxID=168488 RepID=A0AAV6XIW3_9LAMI|nr:hypothetical protein BUALT_Bualt06G0025400 [Buddleja alternifolia]